ncbi:AraC family transcriptional regulator [Streptomyces viridochromogenes]|uniref:AraC family transcriptional regulator n=1 Tax=Streptomyces viridochromogenes TaxID=1938 RepID=A0A0J7ZP76_STRVR|nr:helix-turn-helix domain-containing protein [Streptomyces viridochromogenes]KMS77212.1 AraC family transcriptional regulator [Streptomyces viridochromogenes]KOG18934.1 AraC family transcriptional regulator [Streptomyces viridochromogenes]KOG19173.1 AraC family transcriptional regulator [Streptomyces viridochromogenes]
MTVSADGLPGTAAPGVPAPPPGLVVVGHFDQPPTYGISRPRGADSWLFTWTTGGRGRLWHGSAEATAGAGDLVVLAPGVPHGYAVDPGARHWRFWWAHCQARTSWRSWLRPYDAGEGMYVVTPTPDSVHGRVEAAFRRMLADARWTGTEAPPATAPGGDAVAVAHGTAARELALCSLEEVVLLTAGTARAQPPRPGIDARVRRAEALMAADPAAPHTVRSLAEHVALSPSRFAHLFTRQLGQSPMRVLREARLRHAARLLESTDLSVERVAAASGFVSPFHFNRVFRERYGRPPGAYRGSGPMVGA